MRVSWPQALAWRLRRQLLDPVGDRATEEVVRRLSAVQAQLASGSELAVRLRQRSSDPGDVAAALGDGRLIKTWAMRGSLHLLTPDEGGAILAVVAAARTWELPSWQRYFRMQPKDWDVMRATVRDALAGPPLTREELNEAIAAQPRLGHLGDELRSSWGTLLKPLAWQGDLCYGPTQGTRVTFTRPDLASSRWAGLPPLEEAAPAVLNRYLAAYGPATAANMRAWLSRGRIGPRLFREWMTHLGNVVTEVDVEGTPAYVRTEDLDDLAATRPTDTVRLLGGFDVWVLGTGSDDPHVVPSARRAAVSRTAGWISPIVVVGGVVSGTWELDGEVVRIAWFQEAGRPPREALRAESQRLAAILGREMETVIAAA